MTLKKAILMSLLAASITACGATETTAPAVAPPAADKAATASLSPETSYKDAPSGVYTLDKTHGYIVFNYAHQGFSKPFLRWRDWDSTLNWNKETPGNSSVSVVIQTAGIDTGVDIFDEHLVEERWFDAEAHPEITFNSTALTKLSDTHGTMAGDLTIKGITKPVVLDVTFNRAAEARDPGSYKIGFSARGKVMRSDWGLDAYVPVVADEVDLIIEVEYGLKPAAK